MSCPDLLMDTFSLHSHFSHLHNSYFSNEAVLFSSSSSESELFVLGNIGEFVLQTDFYFILVLQGKKEEFDAS